MARPLTIVAIPILAILLFPRPAIARDGDPASLRLSGSVRLRYEALGGQARAGLGASDELVSVRTTLAADYDAGPIRIGAELYDSRAYGAEPGSAIGTGEVNALELVQAYVAADLDERFGHGSKATLRAGRFLLNLGSRRLVAADDYRNTTNGYTGLHFDLRTVDGFGAALFYTLPQMRRPDDPDAIRANGVGIDRESFDLRLWGGYLSRQRLFGQTMAEIGYVRLKERDAPGRPTRNRDLHSVSARIIREPATGRFDYELEGIGQLGATRTGLAEVAPRSGVSAWFVHADLGYSFPGPLRARLSLEYDRASGDGPGGRYGRFDTIFGMRRADLAPAGIYAQIGRANISTPGLRIEVAPGKRLDAFAVYRAMWLAARTDGFSTTGVRDPLGRSGSFAGHQVEGRMRWWLIPRVLRGEVNAAWIAKRRFLRTAPNAPDTGNTRYVSVALSGSF